MSKEILIYGAGGAGRELAFDFSLDKNPHTAWKVIGFIDDTEHLQGQTINGLPVLGGLWYLTNYSGNIAVTILDQPLVRQDLVSKIKKNSKVKFPLIISSACLASPFAEWGEGCIVRPDSGIAPNTEFGSFVFINWGTAIGHDVIIGDYTTVFSGINISGGVCIGAQCVIGSGATILPKVKIGDGSIVGGGSLVNKDIPSGVVAAGVPAKIIRETEK